MTIYDKSIICTDVMYWNQIKTIRGTYIILLDFEHHCTCWWRDEVDQSVTYKRERTKTEREQEMNDDEHT